mmetsp:Transcript_79379/g.212831  ORF Transcript_79379/g.212831 Transcript_79379/m.212831 type:complete len:186 (+) Transcript_79379:61-618(+)
MLASRTLVLGTLFVLLGLCAANPAQLLVQKSLLTNRLVAGKHIPVRYRIFNIGGSAAYDVTLEDEWSSEEFEVISGMSSGQWAKIPAGANISHVVVVRAYSYGYKSSSAARVTYKHGAGESQAQIAQSNDLGLIPVSGKEEDRLSDPHVLEWIVFILGSAALAFLPILLCRPPSSAQAAKKSKKV